MSTVPSTVVNEIKCKYFNLYFILVLSSFPLELVTSKDGQLKVFLKSNLKNSKLTTLITNLALLQKVWKIK